jgi:hypothetical protein
MDAKKRCGCACMAKPEFLSKKKKIEALNRHLSDLEDRADDIREYIKELKASK